jgi:predicted P-loop ATPase
MPIEYPTLKGHLQSVLVAPTVPTSKSSSSCNNSVTTQYWARQSQVDGDWNSSLLQVTKNMVLCGKSDEAIHMCTDTLTTEGYTVEQTRKQVQSMIDGARAKFGRKETRNTATVFAMLTEDARWSSVFAFDELSNRTMIIAKPPFVTGDPKHFKPRPIKDDDYIQVQMWIQRNWGHVNKNVVIDAVNAACGAQIISPVRHYLESLPASTLNIATVFETYFGVEPENDAHREFIHAASSLFLKQAVARAIEAGCKADIVVVFEGAQGIGKSTGLRALFGADWFKDSMPPMGSKDASDYIVGAWCIELAEMAFQKKAEIEQQKAFISRQEEKYRPAYGRNEIVYPRRCVFAATTNRDDWAVDETGNRRFLPIKTTSIDVAALKRDRDAIWASAYAEYVKDPIWWLTDEQAIYSEKQTGKRFEADIWIELIHKYLSKLTETSIRDAFERCFPQNNKDDRPFDPQKITKTEQRRMGACLISAGWKRDGRFTSGERRDQARFVRVSDAQDYR